MEGLIAWLVILFLFFVLPAILKGMAKRRLQQQPPREREEQEATEGPTYEAKADEVARYLESIGIRVARRQPPPLRQPSAPSRPTPVALEEPVPVLPVEEAEPYEGPGTLVAQPLPEPARAAEPVVRVRVLAPRRPAHPPVPMEEAAEPLVALDAPAQAPVVAALQFPVLERRPTTADMRRGVILAEILRRPDFSGLPCDRNLL